MSARWLLDLGNTRLKHAPLHADGRIGAITALSWRERGIMAALSGIVITGEVAYVSSVAAADATVALLGALTQRFARISVARTQAVFADVRIAYDDPDALGVDRFLALLGARARHPRAALVVAVGTALTIDLLDADGRHRGGRIAPSPDLMREALHARAAQLPSSGGAYSEFADGTLDALASGCEGAALALIERSVIAAETVVGAAPALLVHGGGMAALLPHLPQATPVPALVLEGLAQWAEAERRMGPGPPLFVPVTAIP